ncbi:MAG: sigma-70 family RNA polymerase sigma factor [Steroidobacteraceae bacterium]
MPFVPDITMMQSSLDSSLQAQLAPNTRPLSSNESELLLIRRIAEQDRAALHELYGLYYRRLARFLVRVTRRQDVAEEVINDTFFIVWTSAQRFRGESRVSTWIVGIAYRRALKSVRRASLELVALDAPEALQVSEASSTDETREWIERAVSELPVEQRLCLELAYVLGHSCEEIAAICDCSVNTVKTRLFHARRKLRLSLPRLAGATP